MKCISCDDEMQQNPNTFTCSKCGITYFLYNWYDSHFDVISLDELRKLSEKRYMLKNQLMNVDGDKIRIPSFQYESEWIGPNGRLTHFNYAINWLERIKDYVKKSDPNKWCMSPEWKDEIYNEFEKADDQERRMMFSLMYENFFLAMRHWRAGNDII